MFCRHLFKVTSPIRSFSTRATFEAGDYCMLRQIKTNKKFFIGPLRQDGIRDIKGGLIRHDQVLGQPARSIVKAHNGASSFMVHFPTLDEYVVSVSRGCTPIYPKDAATIVQWLDVEPGHRLLEAGTGNGALSLYLARAVAHTGRVDTFDVLDAHSRTAKKHAERYRRGLLREIIHFHVGKVGDMLAMLQTSKDTYDGAVLDMPEPWVELEAVLDVLQNDRFVVCYIPNMTQVLTLAETVQSLPQAFLEECVEVEIKEWEVRPTTIRKRVSAPATEGENLDENHSHTASSTNTIMPSLPTAWVCRPKNFDVRGHTAFLVRIRKTALAESSELLTAAI